MYKQPTTIIFSLLFLCSMQLVFSQDYKFGKVSKEELEEKFYPLDSSANAAFLYRKRHTRTDVVGNAIQLITTYHIRVKIYNKEGFKWASESIELFGTTNSSSEDVSSIKGVTYNLENGKIVQTKLNKKNIFVEEINKNWKNKKFTMPNVKEGSVLEWSYKIYSPYFTEIDDVVVQYPIPVKKQEAKIKLLEWFHFNKRQKGYYPFQIAQTSERNHTFDNNDKVVVINNENIPALVNEPYVNNIKNYAASLKFEVASLNAPSLQLYETYATSWENITKKIYQSSNFGGQLDKTSHFKDDLNSLVEMSAPTTEKIVKIFQFVKQKIKWNDNRGKYCTKGVKKAYKEGTGNAAEINLTLVAMLREAGLNASPVLVSTRDNGIPLFPTSKGFNYVIACVEIQNNKILLDATEKYSLPNVLPVRDLNWQGRIVHKDGKSSSIDLFSNKPASEKVFLNATIDTDALVTGSYRATYNNLSALTYRNKYNSVSEQDLMGEFEKTNQDIEITQFKVGNENDLSKPLMYTVGFETDNQVEIIGDKLYFSPLLFLTEKENPFKLEERLYPVDFASPWEERYSVLIKIPDGYKVESKPENGLFSLPENLGSYKFIIHEKGSQLQVLSNIEIKTPIIGSNNYQYLKEFYKLMIDKQLEKVVLSKI